MSNSIRMDSLYVNSMDTRVVASVSYTKDSTFTVSGVQKSEDNSTGAILNISKEGRQKARSMEKAETASKKAGVTSAREVFESERVQIRNESRWDGNPMTILDHMGEVMRLDEPETYVKCKELSTKVFEAGFMTEESELFDTELGLIAYDWFERRCRGNDGWVKNPLTGQHSVIPALEMIYSDSVHDTTFDFYGSEADANVWRYNTKFNVLLPLEMLRQLEETFLNINSLSSAENKKLNSVMQKIDEAVNNMKQAEIDYEGSLKALRFGAKLDESGNATYYATWGGGENKKDVSASTTQELLEKLKVI